MSVTIQTVADEAGVSPATVSRAINDTGNIEPDTRRHVLDVAGRLGYVPNAAAQSLSLDKSGTFGVLLPQLKDGYSSQVVRGLDRAARERDCLLMLSSSRGTEGDLRRALSSMYGRIDGLVVRLPRLDPRRYIDLFPEDLPVVFLSAGPEGHNFSVISIDNRKGARLATRHLIGQGHTRIGVITGDMDDREIQMRMAGNEAAMEAAGLSRDEQWMVEGGSNQASARAAARKLMKTVPRPTAILALNDYVAMTAVQVMKQEGWQVPEDVAVIGFGGAQSTKYFDPPLTTVDARLSDLGNRAITALTDLHGKNRHVEWLDPILRVRASCGGGE